MSDEYDDPVGSARILMLKEKYYHGKVSRVRSEELVRNNQDFLVRDSISKPGDYVLTTKHNGRALHFQINSTRLPTGRVVYHFEEEQFTTIPGLLQFYQSHQRALTVSSGAKIKTPVDINGCPVAKQPESQEIEAAYARVLNPSSAHSSNQNHPRSLSQQAILNRAMRSRPTSEYTFSSPTLSKELPRMPSHHLINRPLPIPIASPRISNEEEQDDSIDDRKQYCDMDYDAMEDVLDASTNGTLPRSIGKNGKSQSTLQLPGSPLSRGFSSCQNLAASKSITSLPSTSNPPPLPPRSRSPNERDSALVSDISDYDEPKFKDQEKNNNDADYDQVRTKLRKTTYESEYSRPEDYDDITSRLRDSGINMQFARSESTLQLLDGLKRKLKLMGIDEICKEICRQDAQLIGFVDTVDRPKTENGLRQILLPSGSKLRDELISRSRSMQLVVVMTIIHEKKSSPYMLSFWTEVAYDLFNTYGNFFAFANIMQGLQSKILINQKWLWSLLDTQAEGRYEKLLKTFQRLRSTGEPPHSSSPCSIPLLHPVLELFTVSTTAFMDGRSFSAEIDSLWRWLEMARAWTTVADEMKERARERFNLSPKKGEKEGGGPLSHSVFTSLVSDPSCEEEKRYHPALGAIEILLQRL